MDAIVKVLAIVALGILILMGGTCLLAIGGFMAGVDEARQGVQTNEEREPFDPDELVVVQTFTGSGGQTTRPFTVSDRWEIEWDARGDIFQLYLYDADGGMETPMGEVPRGVPANQMGPGTGSSYQSRGGSYYLQVNAMGDWKIDILAAE